MGLIPVCHRWGVDMVQALLPRIDTAIKMISKNN